MNQLTSPLWGLEMMRQSLQASRANDRADKRDERLAGLQQQSMDMRGRELDARLEGLDLEREQAQQQNRLKQIALAGQLAAAVKGSANPALTYKIARQQYLSVFPDDADFPEEYSPEFVDAVAGAVQKAKEQGFTLSAGQSRYDAEGNVVASAPAAPSTPSDKLYTLNPGDVLVDATGNRVASGAPKPQAGTAGGTLPADAQMVEYLTRNNIAPDRSEAYRMVKLSKNDPTKLVSQLVMDAEENQARQFIGPGDEGYKDRKTLIREARQMVEEIQTGGTAPLAEETASPPPGSPPVNQAGMKFPVPPRPGQKKVVRRGTHAGRPVVQYDDGTIEYAD